MFPPLAPITRLIIIVTVLCYGGQLLAQGWTEYYFALWPFGSQATPYSAPFRPWQVVTYAFMHGGLTHIFFNMFALLMFGSDIERSMGQVKYITYYFVCLVGAAIAQLIVMYMSHSPPFPTVGASGAVFGILLAFGVGFPERRLIVFPIPVPIPARIFVGLYCALELYLGVTGTQQGVAHFAHLGGAAAGLLLILYWRHGPQRP